MKEKKEYAGPKLTFTMYVPAEYYDAICEYCRDKQMTRNAFFIESAREKLGKLGLLERGVQNEQPLAG